MPAPAPTDSIHSATAAHFNYNEAALYKVIEDLEDAYKLEIVLENEKMKNEAEPERSDFVGLNVDDLGEKGFHRNDEPPMPIFVIAASSTRPKLRPPGQVSRQRGSWIVGLAATT